MSHMTTRKEIDLRLAINAISDVVQNRPRPLRDFAQIYMKTGDMVLQSELVAYWANDKRLAFIGDGDAISVCIAYLMKRSIIDYGPSEIVVFDFDERICGAVTRFADKEGLKMLRSELYNCIEPYRGSTDFDCFYTNPPWGASNDGESVKVFVRRGMEATGYHGEGVVVIADDPELPWTRHVLAKVQQFALASGYFVQRMMPRMHSYHLDDSPDLLSCNIFFSAQFGNKGPSKSERVCDATQLSNFYGTGNAATVRYVREKKRLDYGKAHDDEYMFEMWDGENAKLS